MDHPILAQLPLLAHVTAEQRQQIVSSGSTRRLQGGELLFHEGDPAEAMWAVLTGRLKLVRYSPKGKEMLLHLVHPGQTFAEAALFGKGTYPATAEAVVDSELWSLPRALLAELMVASPQLGLAMVASVSVWTRRLVSKLEVLTQRRVEERLAIYLLARVGRRSFEPGELITLEDPKQLIAAQCGTAPEVLSRTLRRLEEEGILRTEGSRLQVLNPVRLGELAEWIAE